MVNALAVFYSCDFLNVILRYSIGIVDLLIT